MKAKLVLEDGSVFEGISIGTDGERIGEVALNTAVVGYQEIMTDPTNAGKILVLTYPLIGNYGVAKKFYESKRSWIGALVIKEKSNSASNWQAEATIDDFLRDENMVAISEVDTRTLAVKIRDRGEMLGIVSSRDAEKERLLKDLRDYKKKNEKKSFISRISTKRITKIKGSPAGQEIAILDLGVLNGFVKQLKDLGCNITLLPYNTSAEEILELNPNGLIISSGPEDDEMIPAVVEEVQRLLGKVPILGIALGHEIIALALGGRLKKMKLGHHGVNYPVKSPDSYKGEITVQNHSFVVDEESIKDVDGVEITLRNVNDNTIEEMRSATLRFISAQYYPVSPGFSEVNDVFKRFLRIKKNKQKKSENRRRSRRNKERNRVCQSVKT